MTDRWTDDGRTDVQKTYVAPGTIMLLSHNLTMRGNDITIMVEFRPVV